MIKSAFKILIIIMCISLCFSAVCVSADNEITLYIDGEKIETDVAPVIVNDRTLIPVRCFFEKFNADVIWVDATKQVIIETDDRSIILKIDSNTAYVNNSAIKLDAAPVIKNDRTLVPVRFISEKLGYDVKWDDETKSVYITSPEPEVSQTVITSVSVKKSVVTIKADNFQKPVISTAESPLRYILDFENAVFEGKGAWIEVNSNDITEVRYAQHEGYARVVIETPGEAEFVCNYENGYMTVEVVGEKDDAETDNDIPSFEKEQSVITSVSVEKSGSSSVVTIKADNFQKPVTFTVESPLRYILDFEGAVLSGKDSKISVKTKDITEVRYAQHEEYARVVIETPGEAEFNCIYKEGYMTVEVVGEETDEKIPENNFEEPEEDPEEEEAVKELIYVDNPVVVIDAGHGGKDMGAIGYDDEGNEVIRESKTNLAIALAVKKYLTNNGVNVVMTRTTDNSLGSSEMEDLLARAKIANDANATLFVSIHNNAFTSSEASGTMVLYADTKNKLNYGITSKTLAGNILDPLVDAMGLLDRGIVESPRMVVLYKTDMPSVLIECGFVTCPKDREILLNSQSIEEIAYAISEGIIKTLSKLPKK